MLTLLLVAVSLGVDNFAAAIAIGVSGVDARTRLRVGLVFGAFEAGMPVLGLVIGAQAAGLVGHAARWTGAALLIAVGAYAIIAAARERAAAAREQADSRSPSPGAGDAREVGADRLPDADRARRPDRSPDAGSAMGADRPPDAGGAMGADRPADARGPQGAEGPSEAAAAADDHEAASGPRRATPRSLGRLIVSGLALSLDNLVVGFALGASHTSIVLGAIVIGVVSAALSLAGLELGARAGKWAGERAEQLAGLLLIVVGVALGTGLLG